MSFTMLLFTFGTTILGIINVVINPFIYNYWIIPSIEKRIGKKLEFTIEVYNTYPKFICKWYEIALYIFAKETGMKFLIKNPKTALLQVDYNVKQSTRFEIIYSIFSYSALIFIVLQVFLYFFLQLFGIDMLKLISSLP